jgi:hypothetical protein
MKKSLFIVSIVLFFISCTSNTRAKNWGGTETIQVEKGQKVVNITWKDGNTLWILTEPMDPNYTPKTLKFKEKSSLGIVQGTILLIENR